MSRAVRRMASPTGKGSFSPPEGSGADTMLHLILCHLFEDGPAARIGSAQLAAYGRANAIPPGARSSATKPRLARSPRAPARAPDGERPRVPQGIQQGWSGRRVPSIAARTRQGDRFPSWEECRIAAATPRVPGGQGLTLVQGLGRHRRRHDLPRIRRADSVRSASDSSVSCCTAVILREARAGEANTLIALSISPMKRSMGVKLRVFMPTLYYRPQLRGAGLASGPAVLYTFAPFVNDPENS